MTQPERTTLPSSTTDQIKLADLPWIFLEYGTPLEKLIAGLVLLAAVGIPIGMLTGMMFTLGNLVPNYSEAQQSEVTELNPVAQVQVILEDNPWSEIFLSQYEGMIEDCHLSLGPDANLFMANQVVQHQSFLRKILQALPPIADNTVGTTRAMAQHYWNSLYLQHPNSNLCLGGIRLLEQASTGYLEGNHYTLTEVDGDYIWLPASEETILAAAHLTLETPALPQPELLRVDSDHLLLELILSSPQDILQIEGMQAMSLQPYSVAQVMAFNGLNPDDLPSTHQGSSFTTQELQVYYDRAVKIVVPVDIGRIEQPQVSSGYRVISLLDLFRPGEERNLNETGQPWLTLNDLNANLARFGYESPDTARQVIDLNGLKVSWDGYLFGGQILPRGTDYSALLPTQQLLQLNQLTLNQPVVSGDVIIVPR